MISEQVLTSILEQTIYDTGSLLGPVCWDSWIVHFLAKIGKYDFGQRFRCRVRVLHSDSGPLPFQPGSYVELLFKMFLKWKVNEGPSKGR